MLQKATLRSSVFMRNFLWLLFIFIFYLHLKMFIDLRERQNERQKHPCEKNRLVASHMCTAWWWNSQPRDVPTFWWVSNPPFGGYRTAHQPTAQYPPARAIWILLNKLMKNIENTSWSTSVAHLLLFFCNLNL